MNDAQWWITNGCAGKSYIVIPGSVFEFPDGSRAEWISNKGWKAQEENPKCFGTQPTTVSNLYAERSCFDCPVRNRCAEATYNTPVINARVPDDPIPTVKMSDSPDLTHVENPTSNDKGRKTDQGKPRWSLLPLHTIAQVIKVLEFGASKYSVGNWAHVPEARTRYYDATMRHVEAWWLGEKNDPESGLPHLAHATACLLFLMWFDEKNNDKVATDWIQARADALADVMKRRDPRA